ncbi:MAG: hypothetical protein KJ621_20750 [Proteobacteria bacterium]|nr:hypothetical protein [Pseudomonadota bacterium]MBU1742287.1 hypothetical protein [Pseudomonadota bacterium]
MKKSFTAVVVMGLIISTSSAAYSFDVKRLSRFLPKSIAGFDRDGSVVIIRETNSVSVNAVYNGIYRGKKERIQINIIYDIAGKGARQLLAQATIQPKRGKTTDIRHLRFQGYPAVTAYTEWAFFSGIFISIWINKYVSVHVNHDLERTDVSLVKKIAGSMNLRGLSRLR